MIEIRPIQPHEVSLTKRMILTVAYHVFREEGALEDSITKYLAMGKLQEMDDIQKNYFENGGVFLVTVKDGEIIGSGAIRYLQQDICELKRMWLSIDHHSQGLGYKMMRELLSIAREKGYKKMWLETDRDSQKTAVSFYTRVGFYEIPPYDGDDPEDMAMEIVL